MLKATVCSALLNAISCVYDGVLWWVWKESRRRVAGIWSRLFGNHSVKGKLTSS